jgi:DNA-binding CsgD family transcriptional regulator
LPFHYILFIVGNGGSIYSRNVASGPWGRDVNDALIASIYETALTKESLPQLLEQLGHFAGARGALLQTTCRDGMRWAASPGLAPVFERFLAAGWYSRNDRIERGRALQHRGFFTDTDVYSHDELETLKLYKEFLEPVGWPRLAASFLPGLAEDELVLSLEGFASDRAARSAIPELDKLRPHLARAFMVAARLNLERARAAAECLGLMGSPAAMLGTGRRIVAFNALFETDLPGLAEERKGCLEFHDRRTDRVLDAAMQGGGMSLVARIRERSGHPQKRVVLHVVPVRGAARDVFVGAAALLIVAKPEITRLPTSVLLQELLDLSPAEARLARNLAAGLSIAEAACGNAISESTARTQLKNVFAKTGLSRQSDLVSLLLRSAR